jgi:antitoxin component YwqK of YwqJK toxin-antitoxin module
MKILAFVLLLAVSSALAHAQNRSDAEATYALKGPVRTFRTEIATFVLKDGSYVEGPRVPQMEASFNEDGNRTDFRMYDQNGVFVRRIAMKFDGPRMTEAINYDGAGNMWLRTVQDYDEAGKIKEERNYNGDGSLRSTQSFKRNQRGMLIESIEQRPDGNLVEQMNYRYDGPKLLGHERKLFYPNGSLQSVAIYTAATKQVETTIYKPDGSVANKIYRDNWDFATYSGDGSLQKVAAVSSEHRLADEVTINNGEATTRVSDRPDQLDAHGNWTKETKWQTDSTGTRPLKVTYRILTYY